MKKKNLSTSKDKEDWLAFTKKLENIYDKASDFSKQKSTVNKIRKLDLHGFSLDQANKIVKKFIVESFENGFMPLTGQKSNINKSFFVLL